MLNFNEMQSAIKVVGFWFNEKKSQKFGANELTEACRERNMTFLKVNLEEDLEGGKKFDAFLHKFTALYALALSGDAKAQEMVKKIEKFVADNPNVRIIDPLENIQKLLLRAETYSLLKAITTKEETIFTPNFIVLRPSDVDENLDDLLKENAISFPVVCKTLLAGGGKDAHEMGLVFSSIHLKQWNFPCIVQSFVNHDALLFKLFVIGEKWLVTLRPSLKNFEAGDFKTIPFNSHQVSKSDSCSPLTFVDAKSIKLIKADLSILERIVRIVQRSLASDLLGIDVVIDNTTKRLAIIDVNAFPSYENVPNVMDHIADAIRRRVDSSIEPQSSSCLYLPSLNLDKNYFLQDASESYDSRRLRQVSSRLLHKTDTGSVMDNDN